MAKLKILKQGETDITSNDIWRFSVHSDYPTQKIYASGQTTLTIPAGSNDGIKTINHGLGYAPIVMAMFETEVGRFVKVTGQVKFIPKTVQAMQFFAVSPPLDLIEARVSYESGDDLDTSYVSIGDVIQFQSSPGNMGVLPSPLQANTNYYVVSITDSTYFKVSTTPGGSPVDITDGGGAYGDIFKNITDPYLESLAGTYSVKVTDSDVSFEISPSINTPLVGIDVDIPIYYIILYDQI
jgi:hypothetical protein